MRYLKVIWNHDSPSDPVLLYSEIDANGWERRKVEVFADGKTGYADSMSNSLSTKLSLIRVPSIDEIAMDQQFSPSEISGQEFEEAWRRAKP